MSFRHIKSNSAPAPIGPYSQAVEINNFIFTSGQIALDAVSGKIVDGGVKEQTEKVIKNLSSVLQAAECTLDNVVKTTIFLKDMNDFAQVNEIYSSFFSKALPARSTVEVSRLPKDVLIEIDCIAVK